MSELEILRTLGIGGMGTVYLARRDGERVAVKKLHASIASDPGSVAVLADEARLAACVRHPNVVRVIDIVVDGGVPALVMELIDGVSLSALAEALAGRSLPLDVVAAIGRDVLAGLHAAHEAKNADGVALEIVHRDVSPPNVLLGHDGVARVIDFGIAKAAWRQQHTVDGAIKGKLGYLAPEQLDGRCGRAADLYGVGVVLWELLTGRRFRDAGSAAQILVQILYTPADAPSLHAPEAVALDDVLLRALRIDPEERFGTALEMADALSAVVEAADAARVADVLRASLGREVTVGDARRVVEVLEQAAIAAIVSAPSRTVTVPRRRRSMRSAHATPTFRLIVPDVGVVHLDQEKARRTVSLSRFAGQSRRQGFCTGSAP